MRVQGFVDEGDGEGFHVARVLHAAEDGVDGVEGVLRVCGKDEKVQLVIVRLFLFEPGTQVSTVDFRGGPGEGSLRV